MKLYEINEEILRLTDQLTVDEDTGEISGDVDTICESIDALQMEKKSILEYLAKLVINLRSEAAAVKAEETRLRERRSRLEKKEEHILQILDRECGGEKTNLGVATLNYRKTAKLEVNDPDAAVNWLRDHQYTGCYRVPAPEVSKTEVKKLIAGGTEVPGCELIEGKSYSLR